MAGQAAALTDNDKKWLIAFVAVGVLLLVLSDFQPGAAVSLAGLLLLGLIFRATGKVGN